LTSNGNGNSNSITIASISSSPAETASDQQQRSDHRRPCSSAISSYASAVTRNNVRTRLEERLIASKMTLQEDDPTYLSSLSKFTLFETKR
jgi:hypothetical protein